MAEIINKEHKNVPPDKLREHPANPRQGDVGAIYESIKENGFYGTIVVQKSTGYVLAGNHRLKAAKEVGLDTVPVVYVDVDDERAMRILLADNRTNDLATYDDTALSQLLEHLASTDDGLAGTGYDGDYLDDLLRGLLDEEPKDAEAQVDRAEELKDEWQTETGQIWLIPSADGKRVHRLMCGDSTSEEDVGRLLDGVSIGAIVTDPPYGMDLNTDYSGMKNNPQMAKDKGLSNGNKYKKVIGDDRPFDPLPVLLSWGDPDEQFWFGADYYIKEMPDAGAWLVWDKRLDDSADRMFGSCFELIYSKRKRKRDILRYKWAGIFGTEKEPKRGRMHPTQKSFHVMTDLIRRINEISIIGEPFAGSGTTIVAAENERRTCYAMEIDPGYVAVCLERLKGIGLEPELLKHSCA